ncbi:MAG: type II toxin-antitoxin system ParD family antitoxin [Pseudomonadota bacterium]
MPVKTTLTFSQSDRAHLDNMVASGRYVSISDYVRNLIRMDRARYEETPEEIAAIREKLIRAEQSGTVARSPEQILRDIKTRARADGII